MEKPERKGRSLGCMVAYGFEDRRLELDFEIARSLGATVLEIFPHWRTWPDPASLATRIQDAGFLIHSTHGCWGGQTIHAERVDLGTTDSLRWRESVEDLKRCVDWLNHAGGRCLVVHPGGLSRPDDAEYRREALANGLLALADHARHTGVIICVENMPPGVHPGSRMADLSGLVAEIGRPELGLAVDTGHAHLSGDAREETIAAGRFLATTHVHDNLGSIDNHLIPGHGSIDWTAWAKALDEIGYSGPIMLECIRDLRKQPEAIDSALLEVLQRMAEIHDPGVASGREDCSE